MTLVVRSVGFRWVGAAFTFAACVALAMDATSRAGASAAEKIPAAKKAGDSADQESPVVQAGAESDADPAEKKNDRCEVKAFLSYDRLPAGSQCRVAMVVTIQEGWHINTNPAKPKFNIPTQFTVKSKHGTVLKDVKFPEGIKGAIDKTTKEQAMYYENQVVLHGTLVVPKDAAGETEQLEMEVKYQACRGDLCEPAKTVKVTGKIPVASPGDEVKTINAKYFTAQNQK